MCLNWLQRRRQGGEGEEEEWGAPQIPARSKNNPESQFNER